MKAGTQWLQKAIEAFLETYLEKQGMGGALALLRNVDTETEDLRVMIDGYRWLYQSERQ